MLTECNIETFSEYMKLHNHEEADTLLVLQSIKAVKMTDLLHM